MARQDGPDESPIRMEDTLMDKISDKMPAAIWPVGRFVLYVGACYQIGLQLFLLVAVTPRLYPVR
jgi:hypothetical protein